KGVGPDVLVPVCLERSPDMIISIVGILKAGGAYVPVDPDYPAERIRFMITDTGANLLLTDSRQEAALREMDISPEILLLDESGDLLDSFPTTAMDAGLQRHHLAYVIYTSGSTGKPKGVMNEHGGIVNRLLWKQSYFGLKEGEGVLQKTTFSFDVSVWELLWPLITGARLVFARPQGQKDADYLKEAIRRYDISTVHFVPSMLQVFLDSVGDAETLPLTRIICSGEALKPQQVHDVQLRIPGAELYNLYGPTEAAIDVTCWHAPRHVENNIVPIGQPVSNTQIHILNERGELLPVGVAGELHIGGVQVARGYLNRPELTAERFITDPFNGSGGRLYRTGDLARWLPDGNIEYLGRIDDQVKIRGFRVELGEIENTLLRYPDIRQAAVLVNEDRQGNKRIVAYIVPLSTIDKEALTAFLKNLLPEYMVPVLFVEIEEVPLTVNGKVDRKALPDPHIETLQINDYVAPRNGVESMLADIWQELLGIQRVGIYDNFFELGGDSINTLQIVSRLKRLGYELQPKDIFAAQHISALATIFKSRRQQASIAEQGVLAGESGLLPIQQWYLELSDNAAVPLYQYVIVKIDKHLTATDVDVAVNSLLLCHDALRFSYNNGKQVYGSYTGNIETLSVHAAEEKVIVQQIIDFSRELSSGLDIRKGILLKAALCVSPDKDSNHLLLVVHHLAVDGVSWRILLEDLKLLLQGTAIPDTKTASYRQWYQALEHYRSQPALLQQQTWWEQVVQQHRPLPSDYTYTEKITVKDIATLTCSLDVVRTRQLLQEVPRAYHTNSNDILLCALLLTLHEWRGISNVVIGLEGHGREDGIAELDISRTVGWFTSIAPVALSLPAGKQVADVLKEVKEQLRRTPAKGLGYGVLRYLDQLPSLQHDAQWDILFNYLGQLDNEVIFGASAGDELVVKEKLTLNSVVMEGVLQMQWQYSSRHYKEDSVIAIAEIFLSKLSGLIAHCVEQAAAAPVFTPADYGLEAVMTNEELDRFLDAPFNGAVRRSQLTDLYRLSSLQEGMLFHSLYHEQGGAYIDQFMATVSQVDISLFRQSWETLLRHHTVFRTAFYHDACSVPVQGVYKTAVLPFILLDHRKTEDQEQAIQQYIENDRRQGFDFSEAPLMRITLIQVDDNCYRLVWTFHHILLDGWSVPVLLEELLQTYGSLAAGQTIDIKSEDRYAEYIHYLRHRDTYAEEKYWKAYLQGLSSPGLLPFISGTVNRTRSAGQYRQLTFEADAAFMAQIMRYAHQHRITLNSLVQGVWAYLLSRYTGREQVVYGATVSGRPEEMPDIEKRAGLFINTLPLYTTVDNNRPVGEWLRELQESQLQSRRYQHVELGDVQRWTGIGSELFDTLLVFENYPVNRVLTSHRWQLQMDDLVMKEQTNYPLTIVVMAADTLQVQFSYNETVLEGAYVQAIAQHTEQVLRQIVLANTATLHDVDLITAAERTTLLEDFNATAASYPDVTLVDLIAAQALRTPDAPAVLFEEEVLTYRELDMRTNQLAHYLRTKGVGPDVLVPVCLERSPDMIISIVGILKAGGAYVPVDPDYPAERIRFMITDTGANLLLTDSRQEAALREMDISPEILLLDESGDLLDSFPTTAMDAGLQRHHLAYVIYTSGSTGKPKGVMNEHGGIVNRLLWKQSYFGLKEGEGVLQKTTFSFDVSVWELLWPLITGARLVFARPQGQKDADYLKEAIRRYDISTVHFVPSMLQVFLDSVGDAETLPLTRIICSGEALKPQQVHDVQLRIPGAELYNLYGPTEAAIDVTCWHAPRHVENNIVPIGQPVSNTQIHILNERGELLPVGVAGELHIGGVQVARGYLNRPELTAERFITDPFNGSGGRLYRTGDLARWLPDGNIEYLGRIDDQVK
ncbi:amino acid adenylation domain-containing protein, partial [Chitinophaga sp. 22536]|uniref:amino acid adenylation domain-containing protein n=1 Tax=Chitinophaga sp. 22536 TaxID=3453939 RepID=UPI003F86AE92